MNVHVNAVPANTKAEVAHYLRDFMRSRIVGQETFVDRILLGLFSNGHVLVIGAPGLAKTKAVNALSEVIDCEAKRVQFTPDLLPSDLTGTDVYRAEHGEFVFQQGPLFNSLILADEINRAPAKVQAALLEAMAEKQITVGGTTHALPELFMVLATQNPIEQEGTYPLPEAQLDRFLLQVNVDFPSAEAEREILKLVRGESFGEVKKPERKVSVAEIFAARREALQIYVSEALTEYIIQLIQATRNPGAYGEDLSRMIAYGASPRSTIALDRCARVHAWMRGAEFATPSDVQAVLHDVLRHRIILSFEAEADGKTRDGFIDALVERVPVS